MKTYTFPFAILLSAAAATLVAAAERPQPAQIAATIAPLLDEQAMLVVHADYGSLDTEAIVVPIGKLLGEHAAMAEAALRPAVVLFQALKDAGSKEGFFVTSVADIPKYPGLVMVPLPDNADAKTVGASLGKLPVNEGFRVEQIGNAMISAGPETLERLKKIIPDARPHLVDALAAVNDAPLKIVFTPPTYFRPVIEQTLPELPEVAGGGPSTILTAGVQWAAVGVMLEPQPSIRVVVQSESPEAAAAVAKKFGEVCELVRRNEKVRTRLPEMDQILTMLSPSVENDRVVLILNEENGRLPKLVESVLPK
jgi:hypothetical protein